MLGVLITPKPGRRNEFIECQTANVGIPELCIMNVKTHWNSTTELLERAYLLQEFTREWLQNQKYSDNPATCVSYYSGPSLWVWVRVGTKPLKNWRSGLSITPNCQFRHGSMENLTTCLTWACCQLVAQQVHL